MYYVQKRIEIAYSHKLNLDYPSKCTNLHGHNAIVTIYCKSQQLNKYGMVADFTHIKKIIENKLDHKFLNEIVGFNTTAENLAHWICSQIPTCYKVSFQESEGNLAIYEKDDI